MPLTRKVIVRNKAFERYFSHNGEICSLSFEPDTGVIVIIPVFDDPDIFATIDSLCQCTLTHEKAGVVMVVNHSEACPPNIKAENIRSALAIKRYVHDKQTGRLQFAVIEAFDLPAKHAGVGLARKIAMDAAAAFFYRQGKPDAPILSLDADTWVEPNYLEEVISYFKAHTVAGVAIAYAHRLDGENLSPRVREAMVKYELYLRYYQLALGYTGHPYAYHCIGSAFAVRTADYVAQGGMNKRQAGEDFYFLQKLIATGRFATLKSTCVYPSPRYSVRTPFGTGQAIGQIVADSGDFPVYDFRAFQDLKSFFQEIPTLYKADRTAVSACFRQQTPEIRHYLSRIEGLAMLDEINANCASAGQFIKRFFDNFNAFRVLKYLNYVHETSYSKQAIHAMANELLTAWNIPLTVTPEEALHLLRKLS